MKWEPLKPKPKSEEKPAASKMDPMGAYFDERGDDDWTDEDLAKLKRPGFGGTKSAPDQGRSEKGRA